MHLTAQDDRALTAKAVAHLCGLFSRDAWHSEHVSHSDLASIVKSFCEFIFIFVWAIGMTSCFVYSRRAESSRERTLRRFHESREKGTSGARQARGVPRRQVGLRTNWLIRTLTPITRLTLPPVSPPSQFPPRRAHRGGDLVRTRVRRVLGAPPGAHRGPGFDSHPDRIDALKRPRQTRAKLREPRVLPGESIFIFACVWAIGMMTSCFVLQTDENKFDRYAVDR